MRFRKNPIEFEAVQWTGDNVEELRRFVGTRDAGSFGNVDGFTPIGTYLLAHLNPRATAELWVRANESVLPLEIGEWVVKDSLGFYPCKDEIMRKNNTPITESTDA